MGWLFGKNKNKITIDREDRDFAERLVLWAFRHARGADTYKFRLHLPVENEFPELSGDIRSNLIPLVDRLSLDLCLDQQVTISVFDRKTLEWNTWREGRTLNGEPAMVLQVREEVWVHKAHLIASVVADLAAIKYSPLGDTDHYANEIETHGNIFGYGIIILCAYSRINTGIISQPFLNANVHIYVMSLLCRFHNVDHSVARPYLDDDVYEFLDSSVRNHESSDSFLEFKRKCFREFRIAPLYHASQQLPVYAPELIDVYSKLLTEDTKSYYFNCRGYSLLLHDRFQEAICDFNACIELDPYDAYAFNNRSYCRMFIGDMKGALNDLEVSNTLDPENSFNYRNKGIYLLLHQKPEAALQELELALLKDRKTEHIHFWIGKAHFAMSNLDQAKKHFELSRTTPELPVPEYPL